MGASTRQRTASSRALARIVVLACTGLLAAAATAAPALGEVQARAQLLPPQVQAGESAVLSIEISGAQDAPPPAIPAVDGVRVDYLGAATQVTIVNGRLQASVQHRYQVTADKPGTYRLGPFSVTSGGRKYEAAAVTLQVGGTGQASAPFGKALRLVVHVPRTRLFVREKVPVEVKLYVGAVRAGDLQYPTLPADGCALDRFEEPTQTQEEVDGMTYTVVRFSSSLTPLRTGTLVLGPASTRLNVYERRRGAFFDDPFFSQRRAVSLESEPVSLEVLPLPDEGKPANFTGAVGRFSLEVQASPTELAAGDPVTLRIVLRGNGNLDGVPPPALPESPAWRVYEPHAVAGNAGEFVFEQVVIPVQAAAEIPAIEFSYFDPEAGRYHTERSRPIRVVVRARTESPPAVAAAPTPPAAQEPLGRDIVYIKEQPGRWVHLHAQTSPVVVAAHGGLLAFPLAAYLFDRRRRQRAEDAAFQQRAAASRLATRALEQCNAARSAGRPEEFYDTVAQALRAYLSQRFALPPGRFDATAVQDIPLAEAVRADIARLLEACEAARFGQQVSRAAVDEHWQLFQRVLQACEAKPRRSWYRRLWGAALVGATFALPARAAVPDALFHQGNSAYAAQNFSGAVAAYEAVLEQGVGSASLFFNLGNAYYKLGDLGKAILNYERARYLAPRDADIQANLDFARSAAHAPACPSPLWEKALFPFADRLAPTTLRHAAFVSYVLAIALWCAAFLHRTGRLHWRRAAVAVTAVFFLLAASLAWCTFGRPWERAAVVVVAAVARFAPEHQATEYFRLPAGALVDIREQRGDWLLAARCDGRRGWLPGSALERLAPATPHAPQR